MLNKPYVSPEFTVEDIHRIREYHVEITSEMTDEEKMRYYNQGASKFLQEISESWKDSNAERELQK